MGTVSSLRLPKNTQLTDGEFSRIRAVFADLDDRFSLYRQDSEASRIARGEIRLTRASEPMREMYALGLEWRAKTSGAFDPHRPDGVIDLSGVVKAAGIEAAAEVLRSCDQHDFLLNVGGDLLAAGTDGISGWTAGIVDPSDRLRLLSSVDLDTGRRALATSGTAERGEHIWHRAQMHDEFLQVSVAAADIFTADVLATAIIAGGVLALEELTESCDIDVLAISRIGQIWATPAFRVPKVSA